MLPVHSSHIEVNNASSFGEEHMVGQCELSLYLDYQD